MDDLQIQNHPPVFDKCRKVVSCYILPLLSLLLVFVLISTIVAKFTLERDTPKAPHYSVTPLPIQPTLNP